MATCGCGAELPGRRQKCYTCKATGRTGSRTKQPRVGAKPATKGRTRSTGRASRAGAAKKTAAKPAARKAPAKKTTRARVTYPAGLGARGRLLWKALGHQADTPAGVLAVEACRLADRLERLDSLLAGGESWFDLVEPIKGSRRYIVVIDKTLAEARQQQLAFKQLLAELGATRVKGHGGYGGEQGAPAPPTPAAPPRSPLDEVTRRRQQREQGA